MCVYVCVRVVCVCVCVRACVRACVCVFPGNETLCDLETLKHCFREAQSECVRCVHLVCLQSCFCRSFHLSVFCLSDSPYVCFYPVSYSVCLSVSLSLCLSFCQSVCLSVCLLFSLCPMFHSVSVYRLEISVSVGWAN